MFADNLTTARPASRWLLAWLVAINTSVNSLYSLRTESRRKGAFMQLFLLSKKRKQAEFHVAHS